MSNKDLIANEAPIQVKQEDLLNFYPYAEKIKEVVQGYSSNPYPLTIGIYGKWGSGKTSMLNLIERHIEIFQKEKEDKRYIKFHYNPWLYQSKEEMLFDFFENLTSKLVYSRDTNLQKAGKLINTYSKYLKSVKLSASIGIPKLFNAGATFEPYQILKQLGEDLKGKRPTIFELKEEIDKTLLESNKKIIIFIDDIDRLDKEEIYTLFKLVKVNADFKNLIFLLCLDPDHVANAIYSRYGKKVKAGKDFLEKIINIPIQLPLIEEPDLDHFVKKKIELILKTKKIKKEWVDELYNSLNGHFFNNPREIIRILNSFAVSLYAIGDEVNIHDLFWIEYLKIKFPVTYNKIKSYGQGFKSNSILLNSITFNDFWDQKDNAETGLRKELKEFNSDSFSIVDYLFPMVKHKIISAYENKGLKPEKILNAELRINHINHFEKYFSFHLKGKISELKFSNYLNHAYNGDEQRAIAILKDLISNSEERIVVYRLSSEIEKEKKDQYKNHFPLLVKNLGIFKGVERHKHSLELARYIGEKLRLSIERDKELILQLIDIPDTEHAGWLIGAFDFRTQYSFKEKVEYIFIKKLKEEKSNPFYEIKSIAKMGMEFWSKQDQAGFESYMLKSLDQRSNLDNFIQIFPNLWNSEIVGVFQEEHYIYITKAIHLNPKKIEGKILLHYPEFKDFKIENVNLDQREEYTMNSAKNNIEQFLYWHNNKKK